MLLAFNSVCSPLPVAYYGNYISDTCRKATKISELQWKRDQSLIYFPEYHTFQRLESIGSFGFGLTNLPYQPNALISI